MKTFLEQISDYLYENHKDELNEICLVFPNRRAALYLKKYLAEKINKVVWLPQIFGIDDFISELSEIDLIDNTSLVFELYEIHKKIETEDKKSFDDFLNLADILIHDFNEIDLYLADAKALYSYLSESKAISLWNLDGKELSAFQKKYLKFFNSLFLYYENLKLKLYAENLGYQGMMYRDTAEKIEKIASDLKWKKIIFAGFNALSAAEELLIRSLQKKAMATVIWDSDPFYLDNEIHEAGKFLRNYKQNWSEAGVFSEDNHYKTSVKNIRIIGLPMKLGQAKYSATILNNLLQENGNLENTALVLNDENLLFPVLNSIPEEIGKFNLSMGLPFKNTILYILIDGILNMQENRSRMFKLEKGRNVFYFKDIAAVFENSYLRVYFNLDEILRKISKSNRIFYSKKEIQNIFDNSNIKKINSLICLFEDWETEIDILRNLKELINTLHEVFKSESNKSFELEILFQFSKLLSQLGNYLINKSESINIKGFRKLYKRFISSQSIPYYGEPLEGLQIMGMLETRTLDFENMILLSANEGILPSSRSYNSMIPLDIKKIFGLPDYSDKDAVFAYHFYRGLQRAKNIFILYNTEADEFSDDDKSRFIHQIINELNDYNPNIVINDYFVNLLNNMQENKPKIRIEKDDSIFKKLIQISINGFSASKLNDYINCSLQFYFKHIAEISETEETEEVIESNTLGNVIHNVLADLYKPFINKVLNQSDIENMLNEVDNLTETYFEKLYKDGDLSFGINLLTVKMAKINVRNFLKSEKENIAELLSLNRFLTIKMLEEQLECIIDCENNDIPLIKLKGFVDRIDSDENQIRIIDYKTGKVEAKNLKVSDSEMLLTENTLSKSLQLLVYSLLFFKENPEYRQAFLAGIFSLRNQMKGFMSLNFEGKETLTSEDLDKFEKILIELFKEIFDKNIEFKQDDKIENCIYCAYKELCGR